MEAIIGTREVLKAIERGEVKKVIIASNAPDWIREKLEKAAKEKGVEIEHFSGDEERLGTRFGKPFPIACAGVKSDER